MKILVAFYSNTGNTEKIALKIKEFFQEKKAEVELLKIMPANEMKPKEIRKACEIKIKNPVPDVGQFDLVFVGTPVWGLNANPIIVSFLKALENVREKKFVLFASCHGFTGSTIKKMSSILVTKGAIVTGSFVLKSLFALDEKKLAKTREFCEKTVSRL